MSTYNLINAEDQQDLVTFYPNFLRTHSKLNTQKSSKITSKKCSKIKSKVKNWSFFHQKIKEPYFGGKLKMICVLVMASNIQGIICTMVTGKMIWRMAKVLCFFLMVINMKDSG